MAAGGSCVFVVLCSVSSWVVLKETELIVMLSLVLELLLVPRTRNECRNVEYEKTRYEDEYKNMAPFTIQTCLPRTRSQGSPLSASKFNPCSVAAVRRDLYPSAIICEFACATCRKSFDATSGYPT